MGPLSAQAYVRRDLASLTTQPVLEVELSDPVNVGEGTLGPVCVCVCVYTMHACACVLNAKQRCACMHGSPARAVIIVCRHCPLQVWVLWWHLT